MIELVRGVAYLNPDGTVSHRVMYANIAQECYQHNWTLPWVYRFDGSAPLPDGFCLADQYMVELEHLLVAN